MESVRLRLVFDRALAESLTENANGLKRFWVLLKPQHKTISDLSHYLLDVFNIHNACPEGLLLSMEGFVLPPFESTCVLKDRDIVRVKRKEKGNFGMLEFGGDRELVAADGGVQFLANEEFEKEAGGYESDDPEEEDELETQELTKICKKRKASEELGSSKKKKKLKKKELSSGAEKCKVVSEDNEEEETSIAASKKDKKGPGAGEDTSKARKSNEPNEGTDDHVAASCTPNEIKKTPSRSARRKKAKRQWLKELRRAEKEKEAKQLSVPPNEKASRKKKDKATAQLTGKEEKRLPVTPNEKASQKKKNHKAIEVPVENEKHVSIEEIPDKGSKKVQVEDLQPDQNTDKDDEIVPVVIRPGHIRFEPLPEGGADQAIQQNQTPMDTSQWNGMSKKKGQKWGKQNSESWNCNDNGNFNHNKPCETWKDNLNSSQKPSIEEEAPVLNLIEFEKLAPYASSPKEGDTIAYRLIQLSSSWTPELSPYLVGKISHFNPQSNKIKLVSVPKHSLIPQNDEEDEALPETCALQEDGSLEMDYSSLLEVRAVNCTGSNNPAESGTVARTMDTTAEVQATPTKAVKNLSSGEGNPWDEISQALSAKKTELAQVDNWSSGRNQNQRTVKPWRGSALGPTMALLRAQNGL